MRKILLLNLLTLAVAAVLLFASQQQTSAQNSTFYRVYPLVTAAGQVGFFDQQTGELFVYDANLDNCIYKVRIERLGEPLKQIKSPSAKMQK